MALRPRRGCAPSRLLVISFVAILCLPLVASAGTRLEAISSPAPGVVDLRIDGPIRVIDFKLTEPDRHVFDLENVEVTSPGTLDLGIAPPGEISVSTLERVRWAQYRSGVLPVARVVLDLSAAADVEISWTDRTLTFVVDAEADLRSDSSEAPRDTVGTHPVGTTQGEHEPDEQARSSEALANSSATVTPSPPLVLATEPLGYDSVPLEPLAGAIDEVDAQTAVLALGNSSILVDDSEHESKSPREPAFEPTVAPDQPRKQAQRKSSARSDDSTIDELTLDQASFETAALFESAAEETMADEPITDESVSEDLETTSSQSFIVRTDGKRIRIREPWRIEGKRVIYTTHKGVLASMRLSDVDLEASRGSR